MRKKNNLVIVPEFDPIVLTKLIVSFVSIVAITAKSKMISRL